jgi:hypothetical protein
MEYLRLGRRICDWPALENRTVAMPISGEKAPITNSFAARHCFRPGSGPKWRRRVYRVAAISARLPVVIRAVGYCVGMLATLSALVVMSLVVGGGAVAAAAATPVITDVSPTHGPGTGGTVVTVSGSGFGTDAAVSWDGGAPITPGSIAANGTSLTFTTPAHAASLVDLRVTSGGATSEQSAVDAFWFDEVGGKPAPPVLEVVSDNPTREGSAFFFGRRIPGYSATVYEEPAGNVACSIPAFAEPIFKCEVGGPGAPLAVGVHHFQATQSAPGGLTSEQSPTVDVTVLEPLAPPAIIPSPTITSPRNDSTFDAPTLHVSGTGIPRAELHVFAEGFGECVQIVSPSGRWSCTMTLNSPKISQPLQRTVAILAGQIVSGPPLGKSDLSEIEVTMLIPPPKIVTPADGSVIPGPAKVKISGSGIAVGVVTVTVYDHGKQICTATVQKSGGGSWTCTATLGIGSDALTATQHDAFGNRSRPSQVVSLSVTAPAVPQSTSHAELAATGRAIGGQIILALAMLVAGFIALCVGATSPRRRSSVHR